MELIRAGRYRHFKGNEYEVLGLAKHSETEEEMVVYRALYGARELWVRPAAMWTQSVEREGKMMPRFTYLGGTPAQFGHENLSASNLARAEKFYAEALGLSVFKRLQGAAAPMLWLGFSDGTATPEFFLELTEKSVTPGSGHIAFITDQRDALYQKHSAMGVIEFEIKENGIYFILDPDGNEIEIMPRTALLALAGQDGC